MAVVNTSYFIEEVFSEDLQLGVMVIDGLIEPAMTSKLYTYAHTGEFIYVPCKNLRNSRTEFTRKLAS